MRLSKTTNYAIRILVDCARADTRLVKVADIAERQDITPQNTFKIVHLLSRAGFIRAVRGRHGGVQLARPPEKIRIGDVVRAMEAMRVDGESEDSPAKGRSREQIRQLTSLFDSALEAFISVLDEHTLEEMARGSRPDAPAKSRRSRTTGQPLRVARPARREAGSS
jgi:Rrf2 family nitric oxide-sensitive transcriptional repressor